MKHRVAYVFRVAVSLVTSSALLAIVAFAQTTNRGTGRSNVNKSRRETVNKPRNETLKICQGVPIPAGYVIVAYLTSSTCPHGVYILKKQDPDSESLKISKRGAAEPDPKRASSEPAGTTAQTQQNAGTSASVMRPRRVGGGQARGEAPTLSGVQTESPARPPTLTGVTSSGVTALGSPVNASSHADSAAGPEEVSEGDVVRVETNLVAVPVSVLDRNGRFIAHLGREDFTISENGVEQSIAYFEPAEKPFTVALLLDTSPSTHFHLSEIKEAAIAFAKQLRPQDRVLIVSFSDQVLLLTEVTNDVNIINPVIIQNATVGTATRLYDAVELVIKERLNKIKGRKAIVLFTDGVDTASHMATYESSIREVDELDALIYPIQYDTTDYLRAMQGGGSVTVVSTKSNWPFPGSSSSQVTYPTPSNGGLPLPGATKADYDRANEYLRELAEKTAGRLYKANTTAQLAEAFASIAEELRRQYTLGYYPQTAAVDSGERRQ
ncbi:MAG: VWA domain-containing protein, partial [Pyrinomonadaceae bacterium]